MQNIKTKIEKYFNLFLDVCLKNFDGLKSVSFSTKKKTIKLLWKFKMIAQMRIFQ